MTCANIAVCSGFIAQFPYLSRLALRIRSQSLAERAGKLSFSLGIPVGVVICAHSIMTLQRLIGAGGANKEITMIVGLASIGVLIFGFSYLRLLAGLAKALAEQRVLALQTWDRGA